MSQCHKCDNPCGHVLTFQIPSTMGYCVIGPILEALPGASEEQIEAATKILLGCRPCWACEKRGDHYICIDPDSGRSETLPDEIPCQLFEMRTNKREGEE